MFHPHLETNSVTIVSHAVADWNIYKKWNEKFFRECYEGYLNGRAEKDPSEGWYKVGEVCRDFLVLDCQDYLSDIFNAFSLLMQGEMGFFDFYIIPLAKKLATCGVFGVSSDEFLNYAVANRKEWEVKGEDIVKEYIDNFRKGKSV